MSDRPPIKAPQIDASTQEFWDAARRGVLRIKHCNACGANHYYPRPFCPTCWSTDVEWIDAAGTGTLYTYSVVHANDLPSFRYRVPYVVAMVDLDEGPRMETNLVECPLDQIHVGMRVAVVFEDEGELVLPRFRPASR
jgi:uncharacterized OB-fold protein